MICNKCNTSNKEGSTFCVECGSTLNEHKKLCPICKQVISTSDEYCCNCHYYIKEGYKLCRRCGEELEDSNTYCPKCKTKNKVISNKKLRLSIFSLLLLNIISIGLILVGIIFPAEVRLHYYAEFSVIHRYFNVDISDSRDFNVILIAVVVGVVFSIVLMTLLLKLASKIKSGDRSRKKYKTLSWLFPILLIIISFSFLGASTEYLNTYFELYDSDVSEYFWGFSSVYFPLYVVGAITTIVVFLINIILYFTSLPQINMLSQKQNDLRLSDLATDQEQSNSSYHNFYGQKDSLPMIIFLSIITFNIYTYFWIHKTTKNLKFMNNDYSDNVGIILACIFIPFYKIYWYNKYSSQAYVMHRKKDIISEDFVSVITLLSVFIPIVGYAIFASKMNKLYELDY